MSRTYKTGRPNGKSCLGFIGVANKAKSTPSGSSHGQQAQEATTSHASCGSQAQQTTQPNTSQTVRPESTSLDVNRSQLSPQTGSSQTGTPQSTVPPIQLRPQSSVSTTLQRVTNSTALTDSVRPIVAEGGNFGN